MILFFFNFSFRANFDKNLSYCEGFDSIIVKIANDTHSLDAFSSYFDQSTDLPLPLNCYSVSPVVLPTAEKRFDNSLYCSWKTSRLTSEMMIKPDSKIKGKELPLIDVIINAGGPIADMQWCPIDNVEKPWLEDQFLAVAYNKSNARILCL